MQNAPGRNRCYTHRNRRGFNMPRFSLVIPAYDKRSCLRLESVSGAGAAYGEPDAIEVIVADNQSTDATTQIAAAYGCRVVAVEKRVIAAARNGGARAALGEIVCFFSTPIRNCIHRPSSKSIAHSLPVVVSAARQACVWSAGRSASP